MDPDWDGTRENASRAFRLHSVFKGLTSDNGIFGQDKDRNRTHRQSSSALFVGRAGNVNGYSIVFVWPQRQREQLLTIMTILNCSDCLCDARKKHTN